MGQIAAVELDPHCIFHRRKRRCKLAVTGLQQPGRAILRVAGQYVNASAPSARSHQVIEPGSSWSTVCHQM